jgi:ATP-dependent Clp protease ATP-binding subunit ClpA
VLGLLSAPNSVAVRALADQRITAEALREAATAAVPVQHDASEPPVLIPYGPAAKKVLELSMREALRLGHNYIGTEHLLLALLDRESETGGVLTALGVDKAAVGSFVQNFLEQFQKA